MTLKILQIKETCTGCGACVSICPKVALSLNYDKSGFYFPQLDLNKCVDCKLCEKVCHVINNESPISASKGYQAYMLKAKDGELILKSSSGGVFSLLANEIIREGGIVYGARYNFPKERLEHVSTDCYPLSDLRKSKYIESFMGMTCKDIGEQLQKGRKILFCGTPCQVEGLHRYLLCKKIDVTNLLLVRFICHGVPSNKFFTEYKHYEERKHKSKMSFFDFRPKTRGWRNSDWKMQFENGKEEIGPCHHYYYYYYFQLSTLLRTSCYHCKRVYHEIADITIGDFWGIHMYRPENSDQEGISLVMLHTDKARNLLSNIAPYCDIEPIPLAALDYIYKEVEGRFQKLSEHKAIMSSVVTHGYMSVAKKTLKNKIKKRKLKYYISVKLHSLKQWINKK